MNSHQNIALTIYPLSYSFKLQLEQKMKMKITYFQFSELRKGSLWQMWRFCRSLYTNHLLLPLENENTKLFLPLLKLVASFTRAKKIIVINYDFAQTPYYKYRIVNSIWNLIFQFIKSYLAYLHSLKDTTDLLKQSPEKCVPENRQQALYIDATIWFTTRSGGSVGHISGVINALAGCGYSIKYAAEGRLSLLTHQVDFIKTDLPRLLTLPAELNHCWYNKQMISQLVQHATGCQFIYQRLSVDNYAGVKLSKLLKIPLIIEYNGSSIWAAENWGNKLRFHKIAKQCESVCIQHAHLIVTISEVLRDQLISFGVSPEKIACYPNCIDPIIFDPTRFTSTVKSALRIRLNIPQNALILTFIGTFGDWHGIEILASAICQFIDRYPQYLQEFNIRFLLIGDGVKMPLIKKILNEKKYREYIVLTGIVPQGEAPEYLAIADIFLSPHINNRDGSKFFGSPTKLFEYMAMGKPIIASNLEQIGQVLKTSLNADNLPKSSPLPNSKELAILCEPGNINHLIKAFIFLAKNPDWRKLLGNNARNEVLNKYTWHNHVSVILKKFRQIIS
jgi:glycosyltransferase involved in cell wall biosynthesis